MPNPEFATYSMIVAQLLNEAREKTEITQAEMLKSSGISQSSWSRTSRGISHLTLEELRAICSTVNVDPNEILKRADQVSSELPEDEGIKILDTLKSTENKSLLPMIITAGALAFLITRVLSKGK